MNKPAPYEIRTGLDGKRYAVFANNFDLEDFEHGCPWLFVGCPVACFGGYENSLCIEGWKQPEGASVNARS